MISLRILRQRSFALLFTARTISVFGNAFTSVALAFAILAVGGSAGEVGLVLAARAVPLVLLLLLGGVWADRLPRQLVMQVANLVSGGSQGALAALLLTGHASIAALAALAAVGGAAQAFFFPASTGLVPQTVDAPDLQAANGLLASSLSAATIAGAALGGLLVAATGPGWAIAVDAGSYFVAAGCMYYLRLPTNPIAFSAREGVWRELRTGWQEFTGRTWVWVVVVQFSIVNAAIAGSMQVLGPLVARRHYHGAAGWGLVLSLDAAGTVVGSLLTTRLPTQRPVFVAVIGSLMLAVPAGLLAIPASLPLIAVSAVLAGLGSGVFGVLWESALQRHVPRTALSRVSAYDALGSFAVIPVGLAIAGPLADAIGLRTTLLGAAVLASTVSVIALLTPAVRRSDDALGLPVRGTHQPTDPVSVEAVRVEDVRVEAEP